MSVISFKPKQITKRLLSQLQTRAHDIIVNRYGLGDDPEPKTLEAIGKKYGITRERVRQIENAALAAIRKGEAFKAEHKVFSEIKDILSTLGVMVHEDELLSSISKDKSVQNHINFYLVLGDEFKKLKEDDAFKSRWTIDEEVSTIIHEALHTVYRNISDQELLAEHDLVQRFLVELKQISEQYKNEEVARRWLSISKKIAKNPLGEWGPADSQNVKTRGIKDYAYLMMKKHGSPMHFREVAKAISDTYGKKTHVATCHNELIKDPRFVLVGRGYYALAEWGYKPGVVRDVIRETLVKEGPLSKEEIIDRVLKERFLKRNTIIVNLQNNKHFKKLDDGRYAAA
ncbi:MAG TPA: sigma factor-like helix-turn-helix DNA-binding protein [Candidatus Paceibacterota bacterium]|nr:sigma factor-like helix-turn-helix DNA-binding protein [Candidatus Paceibacterota bacterium]